MRQRERRTGFWNSPRSPRTPGRPDDIIWFFAQQRFQYPDVSRQQLPTLFFHNNNNDKCRSRRDINSAWIYDICQICFSLRWKLIEIYLGKLEAIPLVLLSLSQRKIKIGRYPFCTQQSVFSNLLKCYACLFTFL